MNNLGDASNIPMPELGILRQSGGKVEQDFIDFDFVVMFKTGAFTDYDQVVSLFNDQVGSVGGLLRQCMTILNDGKKRYRTPEKIFHYLTNVNTVGIDARFFKDALDSINNITQSKLPRNRDLYRMYSILDFQRTLIHALKIIVQTNYGDSINSKIAAINLDTFEELLRKLVGWLNAEIYLVDMAKKHIPKLKEEITDKRKKAESEKDSVFVRGWKWLKDKFS